MSIKTSLLRFRVKLKRILTINPKYSPDESRVIDLVKGLSNNKSTTILSLGDKIIAYNSKVYIKLDYKRMEITDDGEYFEIELTQQSSDKIHHILTSILVSRIRQVEKKISTKKEEMLSKMIGDAQKNYENGY